MSKNSLGRFPSVRNNLVRRQTLKQGYQTANLKEDNTSQNGLSDKKILEQTSQNEISKRIQNKIRMRKASGSQKKLKDTFTGKDSQNFTQSLPDPIQDLRQKIQSLWENSGKIYDALTQSQSNITRDHIKQQILTQLSFILCQTTKGQPLEQIIVDKIRRKLQMQKCIRKCTQKQQSVKNMFEDRIVQLTMILKTR